MSEQRANLLTELSARLTAATQAGDWAALTETDRRIAMLLPRLKPYSPQLQPAIAQLKKAHAEARDRLKDAAAGLGRQMAELGERGEGLRAYHEVGGDA